MTGEQVNLRENGATSGVGVLSAFAYDNLARRTSLTRGNGAVTSYGYDPVSRLASWAENLTGTANDQSATYAYNPASQIVSTTRTNNTYAWTGHGSGSTANVANGLNQLTSVGGAAASYDAKGNLTTDPNSGRTYAYSSENLLTSASGPSSATLAYDPLLRLRHLTGAATTQFAYDGLDLIAEYDGVGTLLRRFVHGPGSDEPLVQYEGTGTTDRRWLHADERGSVVAISDGSGNAITINRYDEYGIPGSANLGRFQYTGQTWLPEVGLYYYKARVYSPTLGRFLQTDPIGTEGGINLYAYVENDPVNYTDPTGLCVGPATTAPNGDIVVTGCPSGGGGGGFGGGYGGIHGEPGEIGPVGRRRPLPPPPPPAPQKEKPKQDCNPTAKAISEGAYDFGTKLTDYSSAVIAAGLVAKSPQGVVVGEIGALAGTGIQALGAAGRFLATGNLTRARYDAIGVAFSLFQSQTKAGSLALGLTAGKAVELRSQLTPGQDCKR